ncbi:hypothetical protein V6N13_099753 [Hibiscus sabdariffa]|uniref:Uncharacterized protein n=1 Tax=Hibiscus sabdariffa TaxID=183260 RepID=A0ABR2NM40_9ROSI
MRFNSNQAKAPTSLELASVTLMPYQILLISFSCVSRVYSSYGVKKLHNQSLRYWDTVNSICSCSSRMVKLSSPFPGSRSLLVYGMTSTSLYGYTSAHQKVS